MSLSRKVILNPVPDGFASVLASATQQPNTYALQKAVEDQLQKHSLAFSSISINENTITIHLSEEIDVLIAANKDIGQQIDSLQVTLDNLTIEDKRISRVDMRFERPVVIFK